MVTRDSLWAEGSLIRINMVSNTPVREPEPVLEMNGGDTVLLPRTRSHGAHE